MSTHPSPPRRRALSFHADYACRQTGVCCRQGWTIPVDPDTSASVSAHLAARRLALPPPHAPFAAFDAGDETRVAFAHDSSGACVFLAGDGTSHCTIHGEIGEAALPIACRQFPRTAVITDAGVDVSLSHFCPTAAARLVDWIGPVSIVDDPACVRGRDLEGLETRGHVPPLVRRGVMCALPAWQQMEAATVALFANAPSPWRAHAVIRGWLARVAAWQVGDGAFDTFAHAALDEAHAQAADALVGAEAILTDWHLAWDAVPRERAARDMGRVTASAVADAMRALDRWNAVVGRYLAAKAFASWIPWHASRCTTYGRALSLAHHVVIVELARLGGAADRHAIVESLGRADLLLVHQVEAAVLVQHLEQARPRT